MTENTEESIEITPQELLAIASGKSENEGFYRSTGNIQLDEYISEEEINTIESSYLNCEFNFYCEGGAIVVECDFENEFIHQASKLLELCSNYVNEKRNNPDSSLNLTLLIVPLLLRGDLTFILMGLTYYAGIDGGATKRVILVFDNTLTNVISAEGVDYKEMQIEIESELTREEAALDKEIYETEKAIKEIENNSIFNNTINDTFNAPLNIDTLQQQLEEKEEIEEERRRSDDAW